MFERFSAGPEEFPVQFDDGETVIVQQENCRVRELYLIGQDPDDDPVGYIFEMDNVDGEPVQKLMSEDLAMFLRAETTTEFIPEYMVIDVPDTPEALTTE